MFLVVEVFKQTTVAAFRNLPLVQVHRLLLVDLEVLRVKDVDVVLVHRLVWHCHVCVGKVATSEGNVAHEPVETRDVLSFNAVHEILKLSPELWSLVLKHNAVLQQDLEECQAQGEEERTVGSYAEPKAGHEDVT